MYDLVIVGAGPGGYTAAIYAARFRLKVLLIGKVRGGELSNAHMVENWPGDKKINGYDLMVRMYDQTKGLGVEIKEETATCINKTAEGFVVESESGKHEAKAVVLATGTERRKLNVPGEKEFLGKGVSYCASCDGAFFKDKVVGVVGGSDAAATEALLLANTCKKVYILYRKAEIRAEPITKERVAKTGNIEIIPNVNVKEVKGDKMVTSVLLDNGQDLELDGLFIEIGGTPVSVFCKDLGLELNDKGEIVVNEKSETNVPGVYAAGDVTDSPYKQAITAAAQGAKAAVFAFSYIKKGGAQ
jgi:thioredoxin reductase (NADPH)